MKSWNLDSICISHLTFSFCGSHLHDAVRNEYEIGTPNANAENWYKRRKLDISYFTLRVILTGNVTLGSKMDSVFIKRSGFLT